MRIADHDVRPGIAQDMGDGDEWPGLREKVMAADILLLATPIWLGHPASHCQRVLERLNADISETDDEEGSCPTARWAWWPSSATRTAPTR